MEDVNLVQKMIVKCIHNFFIHFNVNFFTTNCCSDYITKSVASVLFPLDFDDLNENLLGSSVVSFESSAVRHSDPTKIQKVSVSKKYGVNFSV